MSEYTVRGSASKSAAQMVDESSKPRPAFNITLMRFTKSMLFLAKFIKCEGV